MSAGIARAGVAASRSSPPGRAPAAAGASSSIEAGHQQSGCITDFGACQPVDDSSDCPRAWTAPRETQTVKPTIQRLRRWPLTLALLACATAQADTAIVVTGSLGGTSDFVFRGLSLTRGKPAAQASIDVEFPKEFYVGAFTATCDPNPGPSPPVELDAWAGRYWNLPNNFSADLRLSAYTYPDDPRRVTYDRGELTGTLGWRNQLFVAAIYSPGVRAVATTPGYHEGDAWALEVSARYPVNDRVSLSAGFGNYDLEQVYEDSYQYWNLTVTATVRPVELQFAYLGVSDNAAEHFREESVGDRIALTVLWRFSSTH